MENMNVEYITEEVVEKVEEIIPVQVQKNGVSVTGAVGAALVTYCVLEGAKWLGRKAASVWKNRKKQKIEDDDAIEAILPEIDEEESK